MISTVAAQVPATPTQGPTINYSETNSTSIKVVMDEITDNGDAPILSYQLQRTEASGSNFFDVIGGETNMTLNLEYLVTGLAKGKSYRFRYRTINLVGPSDWSPESFLIPAIVPSTPAQPTYMSSDALSITLGFFRSLDDGGMPILDYELEVDDGELSSSVFTLVAGYDYATDGFAYTVIAADEGMTAISKLYRFRYRSKNEVGYSDYSDTLRIGLGPLPSAPNAPTRAVDGNSESSIALEWDELTGETLDVIDYMVYMDDGQGVIFTKVYDGRCASAIIENLTPGVEYSFYITATNFNGEGAVSNTVSFKSCVKPLQVSAPVLISTTETTITLRWAHPKSDGGCPVSSYAIYRDDGSGGDIVTSMDVANVADKPYLFEHVFTLDSSLTGLDIRYRLGASNEMGESISLQYLTALLAGIPATPTSGPVHSQQESTETMIAVEMPLVTDNGGSTISSYSIAIDDGLQGSFTILLGEKENNLETRVYITQGIHLGRTYRLKYRVRNSIGWSEYSPTSYILVAVAP